MDIGECACACPVGRAETKAEPPTLREIPCTFLNAGERRIRDRRFLALSM